ncbi:hypothetical protein B0T17DRAFT_495959 [Bombardia bombarda]|uniref:Uncharacterized protein n=1 Tax=Bombardia bombarda TaxID=252184 RepID=A0AA39WMV5_9PEZI|nr:hypothetical protein B0T17DRAFT_495959 [Bombardia bombarda]
MEQLHTARRSASHGALSRRYNTPNSSIHPRLASAHPFSRPLRSVNENASLLASPGPLESMLKTTTETGDIGLFSIKPVRSSVSFSGPIRTRPNYGENAFVRSATWDSAETQSLRDDRRRFPSYRDTASEIISMYGSDSQRSASSSLSPHFDDIGQRAYSMTSCSSRPFPNQNLSGPRQTQSGRGLLQRPRSPFPYPTRLKRPGVRPSSPAMTENGCVDYSRMPIYPQYGRRVTPRFSRPNTSSSGPPSSAYNIMTGSQISSGLASSAPTSWESRYRSRSGTSEQSLRTSSLTSIVDMYRPASRTPSLHSRSLRTKPAGNFYYDYSEDFNDIPETVALPLLTLAPIPAALPLRPLAPIPTRAPSMHRPTVLDDVCNIRYRESNEEGRPSMSAPGKERRGSTDREIMKTPQSQSRPDSHINGLEECARWARSQLPRRSSEDQKTTHNLMTSRDLIQAKTNSPLTDSKFPITMSNQKQEVSRSPECKEDARTILSSAIRTSQVSPRSFRLIDHNILKENVRSAATSPVRQGFQPITVRRSRSVSCDTSEKAKTIPSVVGGHLQQHLFYSLDPGLSGMASLVHCIGRTTDPSGQDCAVFRGHRRKFAIPNIRTSQLPDRPISPILAPQPISPVRKLRLQSSVPLLMKALPPLPGSDSARSESCVANTSIDELDIPMRFSPYGPSCISTPRSVLTQPSSKVDAEPTRSFSPCSDSPSSASQSGREEDDCFAVSNPCKQKRNVKSGCIKRKSKASRGTILKTEEETGTIRRSAVTKTSKLWFEMSPEPRRGSSLNRHSPDPTEASRDSKTSNYREDSETCDEDNAFIDSSIPCTPVAAVPSGEETGQNLHGVLVGGRNPMSSVDKTTLSEIRSSFSDDSCASGMPSRGLRKRISHLRIRLTECRLRSTETMTAKDGIMESHGVGDIASGVTLEINTPEIGGIITRPKSADGLIEVSQSQQRGFRGRMSKWMKTARQAVMVACTGPRKQGK